MSTKFKAFRIISRSREDTTGYWMHTPNGRSLHRSSSITSKYTQQLERTVSIDYITSQYIERERKEKKRIEETGWRRQPSRQPRKLAFQFRNHHYVMSCCCLHCDKSESQYYRWFSFLFLVSLCIVHIRHWWRQASFFFLEKSSDKQQDLNTLIIFQRTMTGLSIKLYTYEIYLYS